VIVSGSTGAQTAFDVSFSAVDEDVRWLLRRRTHVRAHIGSAEVLGTLVFDSAPPRDLEVVRARLHLREPVHAFAGVRYVVRRVSPKTLLGGGEIASGYAIADAEPSEIASDVVAAFVHTRGLEPCDVAAIAFAVNLREDAVRSQLDVLVERGSAVALARPTEYVDGGAFEAFTLRVIDALELLQRDEPWAMGMTSLALARALNLAEPLLVRLLSALSDEGRIAARYGYFSTVEHVPKLAADQRSFFERAVPFDPALPFVPVVYDDVAAEVKRSTIPGLGKAFDTLLVRGVLVRVHDALYRGTQIERIHERIESFIDGSGSMTMAQFRDLLGTSRKYAVPLLEWFDSHGITVRSGDLRMLRARRGRREQHV
jgi:selenocysteine-specific elongation factor